MTVEIIMNVFGPQQDSIPSNPIVIDREATTFELIRCKRIGCCPCVEYGLTCCSCDK